MKSREPMDVRALRPLAPPLAPRWVALALLLCISVASFEIGRRIAAPADYPRAPGAAWRDLAALHPAGERP